LVLIRLLVPVVPASRVSLENLLVSKAVEATDSQSPTMRPGPVPAAVPSTPADNVRKLTELNLPIAASVPDSVVSSDWVDSIFSTLPLVWFLGSAFGLVWTVGSYARFCRRVNRTPCCEDERLLQLWQQCCKSAGLKRTGRILQFDGVDQPAIMGLLHPTLLLPSDAPELADQQLRMIMLHELAHVRRWDIAANWGLVAVRAVHWWNPVYWLASARFRTLREQACDAFVVRRIENKSTHDYGAVLLALAERRPIASSWRVMLPASILSFFPSVFRKRAVRVRLRALRNAGVERGPWHAAGVVSVAMLLAISGFTIANEEETPVDIQSILASHPDIVLQLQKRSYEVREVYSGPQESRNYDIAKCVGRIAEDAESTDAARVLLEATLKLLYCREKTAADSKDDGSRSLTYTIRGTTLTAQAPAALHEKLRRTLDAWAESGLSNQIVVTAQFVSTNRDIVSELGISWQFVEAFSSDRGTAFPTRARDGMPVVRAEATVDEYLPIVVATLDPNQSAKLIDRAQGDRRTNVLNAPKITIFNGQEATIADCSQRPFVVGVFQRVAGVNEPKVVVIEEGTKINAFAIVRCDGKKLHLEASLKMSALGEVTTATTTFRGQPVSIQIPRVNRRNIDVVSDIEDGHTLLVGCIPTEHPTKTSEQFPLAKQQYSYYLLTAKGISMKADEKPASSPIRN
jgi:beta-lactamase regulating signal transducer with metallopeptidase domain